MNTENNIKKPPVGLMPEFIHKEYRLDEIIQAIQRFVDAGKDIPKEWYKEREELKKWLSDFNSNQSPSIQKEEKVRDWIILEQRRPMTLKPKISMMDKDEYDFGEPIILRVMRTSDNTIWEVGEEVIRNNYLDTINKFEIDGDRLLAVFCNDETCGSFLLNELSKPKATLFTTTDGVPVRDGDNYFAVSREFRISENTGSAWYNPENGEKYFSTKEAAEQYVLITKPCLSVNDVYEALRYKSSYYSDEWIKKVISELAQSKLK